MTQELDLETYNLDRKGTILILGSYLGLGALIQSTVNSIWLAKKLGKNPYIYWGQSCFYTDKEVGGNTYLRLFQEPKNHENLSFSKNLSVYPTTWMPLNEVETVESLDAKADALRQSHHLTLMSSKEILESDLCIVYDYFSSDTARNLVSTLGVEISTEQFLKECSEIFADYFQPQTTIQMTAQHFWVNSFDRHYQLIVGMHLRGTDKVIEKAVPSPGQYLRLIRRSGYLRRDNAFFVATDSQPYLGDIQSQLSKSLVAFQEMPRSSGAVGLHYDSRTAFQNAVAMITDIELLSRCQVVFAFPGSQIFWWLTRKKEAEKLDFILVPVDPNWFDWFHAGWAVFRLQGWQGFLNFLRFQKPKFINYLKSRFS